MAARKEELKSLLMKVKLESEKADLKLSIQYMKIMASSPHFIANRWETVTDFFYLGFRVTVDGDCSHEIKRCLLPERKIMTF